MESELGKNAKINHSKHQHLRVGKITDFNHSEGEQLRVIKVGTRIEMLVSRPPKSEIPLQ